MIKKEDLLVKEALTVDCESEQNAQNPLCDRGHSYSYQEIPLGESKIAANFYLAISRLDFFIQHHQVLILRDSFLNQQITILHNLFAENFRDRNDFTKEELNKCNQVFEKLINYLNDQVNGEYQQLNDQLRGLHSAYNIIFS